MSYSNQGDSKPIPLPDISLKKVRTQRLMSRICICDDFHWHSHIAPVRDSINNDAQVTSRIIQINKRVNQFQILRSYKFVKLMCSDQYKFSFWWVKEELIGHHPPWHLLKGRGQQLQGWVTSQTVKLLIWGIFSIVIPASSIVPIGVMYNVSKGDQGRNSAEQHVSTEH